MFLTSLIDRGTAEASIPASRTAGPSPRCIILPGSTRPPFFLLQNIDVEILWYAGLCSAREYGPRNGVPASRTQAAGVRYQDANSAGRISTPEQM